MTSLTASRPTVTGISPAEGGPGCKITIRGEYLGQNARDVKNITICGIDCTANLEYSTSRRLTTRMGVVERGRVRHISGPVIITTYSGGQGTSTVEFVCKINIIGLQTESHHWVDEKNMWTAYLQRSKMATDALDFDDPLKIADESNDERKIDESALDQYFPGTSGDTSRENFHPCRFLIERYSSGATLGDLKAGANQLRSSTGSKTYKPLLSFKTHVRTLIDCENALHELKRQLDKDENRINDGEPTNPLGEKLAEIVTDANRTAMLVFEGVLSRREKADNIRIALGALNRLKLLFEIPSSIDRAAKRGQYESVITDYARAKANFTRDGSQKLPAFIQKVYKEVETRMAVFCESLENKLIESPNLPLDVQKRHLNILKSAGDYKASEKVVNNMENWIKVELNGCVKEESNSYAKKMEELTSVLTQNVIKLWRLSSDKVNVKIAERCVNNVLKHYAEIVRLITNKSFGKSSPTCVRILKNVENSLQSLPNSSLKILEELNLDIRLTCSKSLIENTIKDVENLTSRENWIVEDDGKGSHLPRLFQTLVKDSLNQLREILRLEPPIFKKRPNEEKIIKKLLLSLLVSFSTVLEELSKTKSDRLVILLANCDYTCNAIIPNLKELIEECVKINCSNMDIEATNDYKKRRYYFLKEYITLKTSPIIKEMRHQIENIQFSDLVTATKPRPYVIYTINAICLIHSEICLVSEQLVRDVLTPLTSLLISNYIEMLNKVKEWGEFGAIQCQVDVHCLKDAFSLFFSNEQINNLKNAAPKISVDEARNVQNILVASKSQLSMQLNCLLCKN